LETLQYIANKLDIPRRSRRLHEPQRNRERSAPGHNNHAIGESVRQLAEHFIKGDRLQEGMLNRVVRAYDPCLSCSTHAFGIPALEISLVNADGVLLDRLPS
jgi:hypothetical protein